MTYDPPADAACPLPPPDAALERAPRPLTVVPVTDAGQWADLVAQAATPHLQQAFAFGEGKRARGWTVERVCFRDGERTVAICQALEKRVLGMRLLSRISRGPLFISGAPSAADIRAVYGAIGRRWGHPLSPLLIAPALAATEESRAILRDAGFHERKRRGWRSMRVDLGRPVEAIRAALSPTFRNRLRAAERAGLGLRVGEDGAAAEWMIERHRENMRRKRFRGADGDFIRAMRAAAPECHLVFQALRDGRPVAGMSVVRYGPVAEYHTGWFGPEGREANAGNFLMWAILCELRRRGCAQFDAGGLYDGHGYTRFKRGLRGEEYALAGEWIGFGAPKR